MSTLTLIGQVSDALLSREEIYRNHAIELYASLLANANGPHASTDIWFNFGFCVCKRDDNHDHIQYPETGLDGGFSGTRRGLAGLYRELIFSKDTYDAQDTPRLIDSAKTTPAGHSSRCTFKEFLDAYKTSTLADLIDSKGLKATRESLCLYHLKRFLSHKPIGTPSQSVWKLVQCLENPEYLEIPRDVEHDYFFSHTVTLDAAGLQELRKWYVSLLSLGDPLKLHHAMGHRNIRAYAMEVLGIALSANSSDDPYVVNCQITLHNVPACVPWP